MKKITNAWKDSKGYHYELEDGRRFDWPPLPPANVLLGPLGEPWKESDWTELHEREMGLLVNPPADTKIDLPSKGRAL